MRATAALVLLLASLARADGDLLCRGVPSNPRFSSVTATNGKFDVLDAGALNVEGAATTGAGIYTLKGGLAGLGTFTIRTNVDTNFVYINYPIRLQSDVIVDGSLMLQGAGSQLKLVGVADQRTAPTLSGFCTSPSVTWSNGTAVFQLAVGTGCAAATGTITLPTASNGWHCRCDNLTTTSQTIKMTGGTTTTAVMTSSANWVDNDNVRCSCRGG